MKKILFFGLAALCAVSCKSEPKPLEEFSLDGPVSPDYYCQMANGEVYDDAKAEFDTLSYALGMNLGISINVQQRVSQKEVLLLLLLLEKKTMADMSLSQVTEENEQVSLQVLTLCVVRL